MAFLPAALAVASAVVGTAGAVSAAGYKGKVAQQAADVARQNAGVASDRGQIEQIRSDKEYAAIIAEQTAVQSASGFDVLGRSNARVRNSTRGVRRTAAGDIRANATQQSRNFIQEAKNQQGRAKMAGREQIFAGVSGALNIAGAAGGFGGKTKSTSAKAPKATLIGSSRATRKNFIGPR